MKMIVLILGLMSMSLFCVESKVATSKKEWQKCCPNCIWEWSHIRGYMKPTCQCYSNTFHYATLYNTEKRIPIFSQFVLSDKSVSRPEEEFAIEPQLINPKASQNMKQEGDLTPDEKK